MKEYKILRELEPAQPLWAPETTRDRVERNLNELARSGWSVRTFVVNPLSTGSGIVFRPANFAYFVLLEREIPSPAARS